MFSLSEEASAPTTPAAATGDEGSTAPPNWMLDEVRAISHHFDLNKFSSTSEYRDVSPTVL